MHTAAHDLPRTYKRGFEVTAQPDSNANGFGHPRRHGSGRCTAGHGQCRTVKDRLGVKGSNAVVIREVLNPATRGAQDDSIRERWCEPEVTDPLRQPCFT
jgi:hypothetical protein